MTDTVLVAIAVLLRVISNPLANVFQKQLTLKGNNPLVINFLTYFILSVFCLFSLSFIDVSALPVEFWIYSIVAGILGAIGNGLLVKALQMGDLSVLGPINSYKSVIGIIFGIFLLSEIPNTWGVLGVLLIIYGSYFVLDSAEQKFSWEMLKKPEIQFRIWAMILTAIEAIFVKKIIVASSAVLAFVSWSVFGAMFSFVILFYNKSNLIKDLRFTLIPQNLLKFLFLVTCIGLMQYTTNFVFGHMPVGYALSIFQLSTIVSILFGYKFFREKEIKKKLIGAVIMIIGSLLIILLKN